jgi:hypothetical protein
LFLLKLDVVVLVAATTAAQEDRPFALNRRYQLRDRHSAAA